MVEYAISLDSGDSKFHVLPKTRTTDINAVHTYLDMVKDDIRAGKYKSIFPNCANAMIIMHEVTPWCEMNTKTIDYKRNGAVTKGC